MSVSHVERDSEIYGLYEKNRDCETEEEGTKDEEEELWVT